MKIGEKIQFDDQVNNGLINYNTKPIVENEKQKKKQHQLRQIQMLWNHQNQSNEPSSIGLGCDINNNSNGPITLPCLNLQVELFTANRVIAAAQARRRCTSGKMDGYGFDCKWIDQNNSLVH